MGIRTGEPILGAGRDCRIHGTEMFLDARRMLVGAFFTLAYAACAAALGQAPTPDEDHVILWRRVPNNFYSSTLNSDQIQQIVERSPVKTLRLNPGDTISDQLQKQFLVNARWTPAVYSSMVSRIMDLNGLESPDAVKAGEELLVPVIPQTGSASQAQPEQGVGLVLSETELRYTTTRIAALGTLSSAQTEIQYIKVRASDLGRYALDLNTPQGASGPISITLGATRDIAAPPTGSGLLDTSVAERVREGLARGAGPSPILLVVDDSIPDHAEYVRTRDFMLELSKLIREKHGFGESPFGAELKALSTQLPGAQEHLLYPNLAMHASAIKQSLLPLTQLDPQQRVRVIYLPLAATQMGITPIYKELLYLTELLKVAPSGPSSSATTTAFQRNTAKTVTEEIILGNRPVFGYGPIAFSSTGGNSFRSDRALLEALSIVLDAYSSATAQPHALSFSWTMPKLQLPTFLVANALGWKFAAAGNHVAGSASPDFLQRDLQFAARAVGPKDVIAVLNSDGTSGPCASNLFDDSIGIQVLGLSFSGRVDAQRCGTSFSTPRVAWLFAAREAIYGPRLTVPISTPAKVAWYEKQQGLVLGQRSNDQATVLRRYNLEAGKLFGQ